MTASVIQTVSDTAFGVAHYRAEETQRPDALFRDSLASLLVGERGKKIAEAMPMSRMSRQMIVIRTCIIDKFIQASVAEGVALVLNLGAGWDTRPYRMDLPESLIWIEVDYPHMIEFKEQRLSDEKPHCRVERIGIDLADIGERRRMFADVNRRAANLLILTEGVITYLSAEEVGSLADDLRRLDRARFWIVDYSSPELVRYRQKRKMRRGMENAPFKFTPHDWFKFFEQHGWYAADMKYLAEEAERLGRPLKLPLVASIRRLCSFGEGRAKFKKFLGYCLLQPTASAERDAGTLTKTGVQPKC